MVDLVTQEVTKVVSNAAQQVVKIMIEKDYYSSSIIFLKYSCNLLSSNNGFDLLIFYIIFKKAHIIYSVYK